MTHPVIQARADALEKRWKQQAKELKARLDELGVPGGAMRYNSFHSLLTNELDEVALPKFVYDHDRDGNGRIYMSVNGQVIETLTADETHWYQRGYVVRRLYDRFMEWYKQPAPGHQT